MLDAPRIKPFITTPWGHNKERTLLLLRPGIEVDGMYMPCETLASQFTADEYSHRPAHAQQEHEMVP